MSYQVVAATESRVPDRSRMAQPDAAWAVMQDGTCQGQCSVWWSNTPQYAGHKLGVIGEYRVAEDAAADVLLHHAIKGLAAQGCSYVIGPMDQNTWHDYRFIVDSDGRPPFFLEPQPAFQGAAQFERSGFHRLAHFFSAHVDDLSIRTARIDRIRARFPETSMHLRALDKKRFVDDLKQIHKVATVAFQEHLLYQPIPESEFIAMYEPLKHQVVNDLILLAEQAGRVVGFCFAVPDLLQAVRQEPVDTVVVKTFGVLPERRLAGLGQVLLEEVQHRAAAAGFRRAIHALVVEGGAVERISRRYAAPFRRYALFGQELV